MVGQKAAFDRQVLTQSTRLEPTRTMRKSTEAAMAAAAAAAATTTANRTRRRMIRASSQPLNGHPALTTASVRLPQVAQAGAKAAALILWTSFIRRLNVELRRADSCAAVAATLSASPITVP